MEKGDFVKVILASNTKREILIDDEDFERLNAYSWYDRKDMVFRAVGQRRYRIYISISNQIYRNFSVTYDHKDRNPLNNQKENLRECTNSQNGANRGKQKYTTSKYKGVHIHTKNKNYIASIRVNKKQMHIGSFALEVDAAKAYNEAAKKHFGEFACLNQL